MEKSSLVCILFLHFLPPLPSSSYLLSAYYFSLSLSPSLPRSSGYGVNQVPFISSCGQTISNCSSSSTSCQMLIPYCTTQTGQYIIGVMATSTSQTISAPVTYTVTITFNQSEFFPSAFYFRLPLNFLPFVLFY
jgi:hypothetical protein